MNSSPLCRTRTLIASILMALLIAPMTAQAESTSLDKMAELAGGEERNDFLGLGTSLCGSYSTGRDVIAGMKESIKFAMKKVDGNKNPSKREIVEFLNKHKNKLTCWGRHYLMKAFDEGVYMTVYKKLFKEDLYSKDEFKIDYNAVMKIYNPETKLSEPMTILDYIEKVALKSFTIKDSPDSVSNIKYSSFGVHLLTNKSELPLTLGPLAAK